MVDPENRDVGYLTGRLFAALIGLEAAAERPGRRRLGTDNASVVALRSEYLLALSLANVPRWLDQLDRRDKEVALRHHVRIKALQRQLADALVEDQRDRNRRISEGYSGQEADDYASGLRPDLEIPLDPAGSDDPDPH